MLEPHTSSRTSMARRQVWRITTRVPAGTNLTGDILVSPFLPLERNAQLDTPAKTICQHLKRFRLRSRRLQRSTHLQIGSSPCRRWVLFTINPAHATSPSCAPYYCSVCVADGSRPG